VAPVVLFNGGMMIMMIITSESTNVKYNRFNTETKAESTMNSNNRIVATLFSLGT